MERFLMSELICRSEQISRMSTSFIVALEVLYFIVFFSTGASNFRETRFVKYSSAG